MEQQLPLLDDDEVEAANRRAARTASVEAAESPAAGPDWRLDDRTKTVGRQGIEAARRALAHHAAAA